MVFFLLVIALFLHEFNELNHAEADAVEAIAELQSTLAHRAPGVER